MPTPLGHLLASGVPVNGVTVWDEVLARVGTSFELPQGGQLELAGSVGGRNADDGATIMQCGLKDPAIELGGPVPRLAVGAR
jgi:hypothetical protein